MTDNKKSIREYGIIDDGRVIEIQPMTVNVIVGTSDDDSTSTSKREVDPMK